jgi:hypothetical protein
MWTGRGKYYNGPCEDNMYCAKRMWTGRGKYYNGPCEDNMY